MKKIFIIAGEASGDNLGAKLVKSCENSNYEFFGVGGDKMSDAGVKLLFHYKEISVLGLAEVIMMYFKLRKKSYEVVDAIQQYNPDLIITIDFPGFNFRLIKKLQKIYGKKVNAIHYVAPTVWAYAPQRAQIVADLYNYMMLILPFEEKYFQHMPHAYVGHPIMDELEISYIDEIKQKDREKIDNNEYVITVLPGSRKSEIKRHMAVLMESVAQFHKINSFKGKKIFVYFLTLPHLKDFVENLVKKYSKNCDIKILVESDDTKHEKIIKKSIIGITKCGTVTLTFMKHFIPSISFYQLSNITAWIMKRKLIISNFNLCNIILERKFVPELIQENFTSENLLNNIEKLCTNLDDREKMIDGYFSIIEILKNSPPTQVSKILKKVL